MDEEARRREALSRYCVLDTPPEEAFDRLAWLAADLLDAPFAAIALADRERCWIKSRYQRPGTGPTEDAPREVKRAASLIDQVLAAEGFGPVVSNDCRLDPRFQNSSLVTHAGVRFLVAVPLHAGAGLKIGMLCCGDFAPRETPNPRVLKQLEVMAGIVVSTLEERATEQARAQAAEQAELLKAGLSCSNDAIIIAEIPPGATTARTVFVNEAFCDLTGYSREEVIGAPPTLIRAPETDPEHIARFHAALMKGEPIRLEMLGRRKNGERYWAEVSSAAIGERGEGRPSHYITVQREVTEAMRARQAAMERERLMELGESVARMGHWHVDLATHRAVWSPQLYRLYGHEPGDVPAGLTTLFAQMDPADHAKLRGVLDEASRSGRAQTRFTMFVHGEARIIDVRAVCHYNDQGAPATLFGVSQDVTERAVLEADLVEAKHRAEAAAEAKAEFLANMTHELRTPLTAIVGFAELLSRITGLPDPAPGHIGRIMTASDALLAIVNDVLDFSKLESGAFELERRPFDLRELVEDTAALVGERAAAKTIGLAAEVAADAPRWLVGDANRLRQIMLNLVGNAVKFTDHGRVAVTAGYGPGPDGAEGLTLTVADTGIGISDEVRARLFDRFVQGDGSVSRRFGGTGLGLAICKRLVELMGGSIEVTSEAGRGSTFTVFVPLAVGEGPAAAQSPLGAADLSALRVLLADDAEANRALLSTILQAVGVTVRTVENGREAVEAAQAEVFDLVLMDVHMPLMDGVQATRRIRALGGRSAALPIVALTANVLPEQVATYREAGMDDHLGKPVRPAELVAAVARWGLRDEVREPRRVRA